MAVDDKIDESRRLFMLGSMYLAGSIAAPQLLSAADTGISTQQRFFLNGNHAFITRARNEKYTANIVTADRKSTRLNSSHSDRSRMPSSA